MDLEKKKRARNFCESEIKLFTEVLLPKYKSVIENKRSDAVTRGEKATAWKDLWVEFNSISKFCFRTEENLKNLWDKLKKDARKSKAHERREMFATGGGSKDTTGEPSAVELKVLAVIGPSGVGLINHYDGDAIHTEENLDFDLAVGAEAQTEVEQIDFSSIPVPSSGNSTTKAAEQPSNSNWSEYVPRKLNSPKSPAIRPNTDSACGSSSSSERKRSITEELEWAKVMRRRRPSVTAADDTTVKLAQAKLELTELTKKTMEAENQRNEERFELEKKRKEYEVELAQLQVLKMKRDLGLE